MGEPTCSIDGCDKPVKANGWCGMHYQRWCRHSDPLYVRETPPPREPEECSVDGCAKPVRGRGLCNGHLERLRLTGDVRADIPLRVASTYAPGTRCAVEGCDNSLRKGGRGWCGMHWARWRKHGDPLVVKIIFGDDRARLESYIDRSGGPDACHPWTGGQHSDGYGWASINRQPKLAHMAVWELENGPKPPGADLDHECHNQAIRDGLCRPGKCPHRLCCNLSHIILRASKKEHAAATPGMVKRRRGTNGNAKLTEVQVRELRMLLADAKDDYEVCEIGRRYGIGRTQTYRIRRGEAWAWLPDAS